MLAAATTGVDPGSFADFSVIQWLRYLGQNSSESLLGKSRWGGSMTVWRAPASDPKTRRSRSTARVRSSSPHR